jgi:nucleotide-binding universal stress UspA family protein
MKTIIASTDFSPNAGQAVAYAAGLARALNARLALFHHFTYPVPATDLPDVVPLYVDELAVELERRLNKVKAGLQEAFPGLEVGVMVRSGDLLRDLEDVFRAERADLVVLGMRGENPGLNALFGSVTARVIRKGKLPAIVVPPDAAFRAPKKILFAFDFDAQTDLRRIEPLVDLAASFDAYVNVLNLFADDDMPAPTAVGRKMLKKQSLDALLGGLRHGYTLEEGTAIADGILEHAAYFGADLLAMIPHHHSYLSNLLQRSATQEVAAKMKAPLLVLAERIPNG